MFSRKAAVFVGSLCLAAGAWAASCGMVPPREFNEAANAEDVDVRPLPPPSGEPEDAGVEADASPDGPNMGTLSVALPWSGISGMPIAKILGRTRDEIESLKMPAEPGTPEQKTAAKADSKLGWIRYTANLRVQFDDDDIAVSFEQEVPAGLSCEAAAKWLGFEEVAATVEKGSKCKWKKGDLGRGVSGNLDRATQLFTASAPAASRAPQN
jgi:hypothetical protein